MTITRRPLTVRVDEKLIDWLSAFAKEDAGRTQASVLESIIAHFQRQFPSVQNKILQQDNIDFFQLAGTLIEGVAWGDHAFKRDWHAWAIEIYADVASNASTMPGIKRLAWYKSGSSWLNFAMVLRRTILMKTQPDDYVWDSYYRAAIESLQISIAYHEAFGELDLNESVEGEGTSNANKDESDVNDAVLFNLACGWALLGQYFVENQDGPAGEISARARTIVHKVADSFHREHDWVSSDETDRDKLRRSLSEEGLVANAMRSAIKTLERIHAGRRKRAGDLPMSVTYWLFDYANEDPDLALLRVVEKQNFERVMKKKGATATILTAFETLRDSVPDEIRDFKPRIEDLQKPQGEEQE